MDRVAVFVDAGYLFAQGSTALTGSKKTRPSLVLDAPRVIKELRTTAAQKAPNCTLLRVYWYDGAASGARMSTDQASLARLDDVKLRLGFVNSSGQQKGVDSLIVTDLIELARLKAITDAVLLSGDEDVRVGVQIAQNYGVRVHLLGIVPSRGSQSLQLLQEADTTNEWNAHTVGQFLSVRAGGVDKGDVALRPIGSATDESSTASAVEQIEIVVKEFVSAMTETDLEGTAAYWKTERGVPSEFDRKLLPMCRSVLGRPLDRVETKHMRACFHSAVEHRLS